MFDCFCLQPPRATGDTEQRNVPFETLPNHQERPWLVDELVAELLHRLYAGRARYVPYLYWYALLINGIEMMLSMYALLTQAGWDHRLKWRPLWHIPKYLRINFALVVPLLTVYSNLAAIVGLLKHQAFLLLPYVCLHLGTFVLELCYLVGIKRTTLPVASMRKHDPNVCPNEPGPWWRWSPLMVVLVGCHLSIVIACLYEPWSWSVSV